MLETDKMEEKPLLDDQERLKDNEELENKVKEYNEGSAI